MRSKQPGKQAHASKRASAKRAKPERGVDLVRLQLAYETTTATLEELGRKFGCTKGYISRKAKELGWKRGGNAERVRAKAEAKVQAADAHKAQVEAETEEAIDTTAQIMADVILGQRAKLQGMTGLAHRMFEELERTQAKAEKARTAAQRKKAVPLSERIDDMRKLGSTVDVLMKLERNVFGITPDTPVDPSRRLEEAVDNGLAGIKQKFESVLAMKGARA